MGDEIFSVYLTPADYSKLAYAKLDLPASPWKLLDAMDKVRLPEGDSLYLEITDYRDFEVLRSSLVCSATNLLELNDLAERLSRLNEVQRIAFEGLVRVDFQKQESITLKRLRDLTESVDCCHVVESVVSDDFTQRMVLFRKWKECQMRHLSFWTLRRSGKWHAWANAAYMFPVESPAWVAM